MTILALFSTILGLALWLGAVVFVTFFVYPVVARRLAPSKAAEVLDLLYYRYYYLGLAGGVLMEVGGSAALVNVSGRIPTITFMCLTGAALVGFLYGGLVTLPRMVDLRQQLQSSAGSDENFPLRDRFDQALRFLVFVNSLVLCFLIGSAIALATMASPETQV